MDEVGRWQEALARLYGKVGAYFLCFRFVIGCFRSEIGSGFCYPILDLAYHSISRIFLAYPSIRLSVCSVHRPSSLSG